jgi:N-acetylglucosaminyldiphosphoundecaprenol N-acetyl-beta-D-mannosaminyltransferase
MHRSDELRKSVLSSSVIYADGMSVVWASRLLGRPLPERVTGIDLMHGVLEQGSVRGYRVFCLGAKQEVLDRVVANFEENYPGVTIAGARNGYFSEDDEEAVAIQIRDSRPDVLFVAITSPKKENFMARWSSMMDVPVVHGVGGSFDVVAGLVQRAPESWQRLGLEWLYRVKQEPGRLWKRYLVTNSLFLGLIIREFFKGNRTR